MLTRERFIQKRKRETLTDYIEEQERRLQEHIYHDNFVKQTLNNIHIARERLNEYPKTN